MKHNTRAAGGRARPPLLPHIHTVMAVWLAPFAMFALPGVASLDARAAVTVTATPQPTPTPLCPIAILRNPNPDPGDAFGAAISATAGGLILVGVPGDDTTGEDSGEA